MMTSSRHQQNILMQSHSWSLVVTRGHSRSLVVYSWSLVVTRGHSWSLVVIRGHSWSLVVTRGHSCVLLDTIKMNCTPQMQCCHEGLPSRREACYCCLQSGDESCPIPAKTRRLGCRSLVYTHPKHGRNLQSHPVASETPSNLHQLFSDHSKLQIRPNHQDRFGTLH